MSVEVGQQAPDFEVRDQFGTPVRLSSFRGEKNVVLVFYPLAFTPTCTGELCAIRDESSVFENDDTVVFGVSCDSPATLKVFAEREGYEFRLLSDFWPHGDVSRAYGVFIEEKGYPMRGTFIIDKAGVVRWSVVNSPADARSTSDYREALAAL
ncbi:MAG TPA: peroxiredoxin [Candidatus Nanopelagicales bacterium]|nr:peroxiredoxin [Candidatus Nanopelagicales bacterium]